MKTKSANLKYYASITQNGKTIWKSRRPCKDTINATIGGAEAMKKLGVPNAQIAILVQAA